MQAIDRLYLVRPENGSRTMTSVLRRMGYTLNRKRVWRHMRPRRSARGPILQVTDGKFHDGVMSVVGVKRHHPSPRERREMNHLFAVLLEAEFFAQQALRWHDMVVVGYHRPTRRIVKRCRREGILHFR